MTISRTLMIFLILLGVLGFPAGARAQLCHRDGTAVACDDGRRGVWSGDAIIWPDGT